MKQGNHGNSKDHSHQAQGHVAAGEGKDRHLHNPMEDRLIPLEPLDLGKDPFDRRLGARHVQDRFHRTAAR